MLNDRVVFKLPGGPHLVWAIVASPVCLNVEKLIID